MNNDPNFPQNNEDPKRLAVVTGASSGIGFFLAQEFARNGFDLVVVAEDEGLETAAIALREQGTLVHTVQADLRDAQEVEKVYAKLQEFSCPVDTLVLNAGVGVGGASFDQTDLLQEIDMLKLNILSTVHLTKLVLPDMLKQGHGRLLFTSSVAAIMPGPYESVYAGTKAFVQSFAEALRVENQDRGITVTALLPGPTETNFFERAGMQDTKVGQSEKDDAERVAKQGFQALMDGKDMVVAGSLMNKIQVTLAKFMPQEMAAKMHGNMSKPASKSGSHSSSTAASRTPSPKH